jgi:hypothetical protein
MLNQHFPPGDMPVTPLDQMRWYEERLRYQVLRFIFDRAGPRCDVVVAPPQIGLALTLRSEEIIRVLDWLDRHGYLHCFGSRPDICLSPKAITFFEEKPERGKSLKE